ncbi:replication initiation protein [Cupriavidus necator]|uniref:replication initiation protein n=1 Tax=Cupriavidus necator TaxID=106590 RepID=UPI003ECE0D9A
MKQIELYPVDAPEARDDRMRKHVNAIALMPTKGGGKISAFDRTLYNVLLYRAQGMGDREEYSARMHEIVKDCDFDSNNTEHIKKALKNLMKTLVEWQSPTSGEIEVWDACVLLSGASIRKDKRTKAVEVRWRYDTQIKAQLLNPDRYAGLMLKSITQLRSHPAKALYEICARYVDNPGRKTARQHWRWWRPVLCGQVYDEQKGEYRYFKRDVLQPAIAEINANTELEVNLLPEFKERDNKTVSDIQFEVRLKALAKKAPTPGIKPLDKVEPADLKLIEQALKLGVAQDEAEGLYRDHGAEALKKGLGDLEKRLAMPAQLVGAVEKPGSYLRSIMRPRAAAQAPAAESTSKARPGKDLERSKAALLEEWLRRKKDELRSLFQELPEVEQEELLSMFRVYPPIQPLIKRFETSGWNHRSIRDVFAAYLGETWHGGEWNKPKPDELIELALERPTTAA